MSVKLLERKAVVWKKCPIDELDEKLKADAAALLGYCGPADTARRSEALQKQVSDIFGKLQIKPFTKASVEKYQEAMKWSGWQVGSLRAAAGAGTATLFFTGMAVAAGIQELYYVMSTFIVAAGLCGAAAVSRLIKGIGPKWAWVKEGMDRREWSNVFQGRIPEFAIQTAVDVKRECDRAGLQCFFAVEVMKEERRHHPDPFLCCCIKDRHAGIETEWMYLEVWNEPKYKQEREV